MPTRPPVHKPYPRRERKGPAAIVLQRRASARVRGYTWRWEKARALHLQAHPFCVECMKAGRYQIGRVVDHIVPHRGNDELFWDRANWQTLCKPHHDAKTAKEDGGFGNRSSTNVKASTG